MGVHRVWHGYCRAGTHRYDCYAARVFWVGGILVVGYMWHGSMCCWINWVGLQYERIFLKY